MTRSRPSRSSAACTTASVEAYLQELRFPAPTAPRTAGLEEAMRYSLLAGGKRIRPVLALATARATDRDPSAVLPLAAAIGPNVKSVHLIGQTAGELAAAIPQARTDGDLASALSAIEAEPGDVILLAPACASYDQFRDFEARGEEFRRLVQNLSA